MLVIALLILAPRRQVKYWEHCVTSLAHRLSYSWHCFTGRVHGFYAETAQRSEQWASAPRTNRADLWVWMCQTRMEFQGALGPRMPQSTGNCPGWGVPKDRKTSLISVRSTRRLPLPSALTTCPLQFCYMRTTWLGYVKNSVTLVMDQVRRLGHGLVPFLGPILHLTGYQRKNTRSLHWMRF